MWETLRNNREAEELKAAADNADRSADDHRRLANGGDVNFWNSVRLSDEAQGFRKQADEILRKSQ